MLCLHYSLVHQALHLPPERKIQMCQVGGARGPGPRPLLYVRNTLIFYGEDLLAPRPTHQLEDQPLPAVRDCLFIYSNVPSISGGRLLRPQPFESCYCHRFSLLHLVRTGFGAHSMGTGGSFPRVKRPVREGDYSLPTSAEVKKTWIYTSTPPYAFME
jgi:hypothetical protein